VKPEAWRALLYIIGVVRLWFMLVQILGF